MLYVMVVVHTLTNVAAMYILIEWTAAQGEVTVDALLCGATIIVLNFARQADVYKVWAFEYGYSTKTKD
jgi:hypothetical protein